MANDDLLQQFKELLAEHNKQLRQEIREDTKSEVKAGVKAEVDPLHERMDTQYKNLTGQINAVKTELTEKIDQQTHDVADILSNAVMPDIDRHETQITELQEAVGLRSKH